MNVVMTSEGRFVEVQGTAEGMAVQPRASSTPCWPSPRAGCQEIFELQDEYVAEPPPRPSRRPVTRPAAWSAPRPTPTRSPRSPPSSATASSCCPGRRRCPTWSRTPHPRGQRPAQGRGPRRGDRAARGGRRHRARGRRPRRRARRVVGAVRRRGRDLRRERRQAAARARRVWPSSTGRPGSAPWRWWRGPTGARSWPRASAPGSIAVEASGARRVRLRPGVRARRGRRAHVRRDDRGGEARHHPPRPGLPGPGREAVRHVRVDGPRLPHRNESRSLHQGNDP